MIFFDLKILEEVCVSMIKKIFSTISLLTVLISTFSVNAFAIGPSYTKWERLLMLITESPLMTTFFIALSLLALSLGITLLKIIKIQRKIVNWFLIRWFGFEYRERRKQFRQKEKPFGLPKGL